MKVKANKRGFTLVELVVVIAILAIIAAIAIPCLINIIDSTTASSGEAQAQTLNQECQNAYNEIKAGTINNTMSKNADGTAVSFAAIKNSGITTKMPHEMQKYLIFILRTQYKYWRILLLHLSSHRKWAYYWNYCLFQHRHSPQY